MYIGRLENKNLLIFFSMFFLVIISMLIAFRGPVDNDYLEYVKFYEHSDKILDIVFGNGTLLRQSDYLYFIIISTFKQLNIGFVSFLFVTTFLSIFLKYLAARRFCSITNSFLALLLWLSLNVFTYEAMQIRYALAMGICVFSFSQKSIRLQVFTFILGFMVHMGILVVGLIFIINKIGINHRKVFRNTILIIILFLIGRTINYSFIPNILSVFKIPTIEYLFGKLIGYLNQQDNHLSIITLFRLVALYLLYVTSVKYNCNEKLLNITFSFFILISIFSGFTVFLGRILPLVEFFSIVAFFSSVQSRVKQTLLSSFIFLILILLTTLIFYYLAIISGNFNLS